MPLTPEQYARIRLNQAMLAGLIDQMPITDLARAWRDLSARFAPQYGNFGNFLRFRGQYGGSFTPPGSRTISAPPPLGVTRTWSPQDPGPQLPFLPPPVIPQ